MAGKDKERSLDKGFPIVGMGASAGGLQALLDFFDHLPDDSGMAFIVIMHLAPNKASNIDSLIKSHTNMEVEQINEKSKILPNYVYVIPPDKKLSIRKNKLKLSEPEQEERASHAAIDIFFRSLAQEHKQKTIGIVLSGAGSDGSLGLAAIKEHGGITLAQDPEEADYDSMPRSAIRTDLVDIVLSVKEMAGKVVELKEILSSASVPSDTEDMDGDERKDLEKIFNKVEGDTGHNFNQYKRSSALRRINRRMHITQCKTIEQYWNYIEDHPKETENLFKDLLISVTSFFRDTEAFKHLEEKIIPELFEGKGPKDQVRVWTTGCASGEEAYSIAIQLYEYAQKMSEPPEIKVFASDIDQKALDIGRKGWFPESIEADVTNERLKRHFIKVDNGYRLKQSIKEIILFASHNLLSDPPFSKQDMIVCRNLLIYFDKSLQEKVLKLLHYTLKQEGYLFLGLSDSPREASELFSSVNRKLGIFKKRIISESEFHLPETPILQNINRNISDGEKKKDPKNNLEKIHYKILARKYAPASVIINESFEVIHASEGIRPYLQYSEGAPSHEIMKMIHPDLRPTMRSLLFQYEKSHNFKAQKTRLNHDGETRQVRLTAQPLQTPDIPDNFLQIVFLELQADETDTEKGDEASEPSEDFERQDHLEELEEELKLTKEQLQGTIEEYEISNEELRASNEELQSMNEELKSTTEELETSKEELQSVNEELRTVNQELEDKIEELSEARDDIKNLIEATQVGIIFVDCNLRIQRYTERASELFNLIESDVGRPIIHVTHQLEYDNLEEDIKRVFKSLTSVKKLISAKNGKWYKMRLLPYRTTEDKIKGVVLTLVDVTPLKETEEALSYKAEQQESIADLGLFALNNIELDPIIENLVDRIRSVTGSDYSLLFEFGDDSESLVVKTGDGIPQKMIGTKIEATAGSEMAYATDSIESVSINDFDTEDRFERSPLLKELEVTSGILVPVQSTERPYGILAIFFTCEEQYSEDELHFMRMAANLLGEAVQRTKAEEKLKQKNRELEERVQERTAELRDVNEELQEKMELQKELQNNLIEAREKEQWRIGEYLHDDLGQEMVGLKLMMDNISSFIKKEDLELPVNWTTIMETIKSATKKVRDLSHQIMPMEIENEGISFAFEHLLQNAEQVHQIDCNFENRAEDQEINSHVSTQLYRIVQEAIQNAAMHGEAEEVAITVDTDSENILLQIRDDGKGFSAQEDDMGMGINIMQYRANLLDGSFDIERLPESEGDGTLVTCTIPIRVAKKDGG